MPIASSPVPQVRRTAELNGAAKPGHARPFAGSLEHILAELERLDLLIEAQIRRVRQSQKQDELQGLYISEQEVDALAAQPIGMPPWAATPLAAANPHVSAALDALQAEIQLRIAQSHRHGIELRLFSLVERFHLSHLDIQIILTCLATELDLRYERMFAYLQDDVSKKRPTVDLVLNLWCSSFEAKTLSRDRFTPHAPLMLYQLVALIEDPSYPKSPLLSRALKLDDRLVSYLLDKEEVDERVAPFISLVTPSLDLFDLVLPAEMTGRLKLLFEQKREQRNSPNVYFQGAYGVGRRSTADALCRIAGCNLLIVDGAYILKSGTDNLISIIRLITREATIQNAAIYWNGFDTLLVDEHYSSRKALLKHLMEWGGIVFLSGETAWEVGEMPGHPYTRFEFPRPLYSSRLRLWQMELPEAGAADSAVLANHFRFTGGQIRDAASIARHLMRQQEVPGTALPMSSLLDVCRLQSNRRLSTVSTHIKPRYTFADIVLPADKMRQLKEIRNAVESRSIVHDEWGFGAKFSLGKGIGLLFAGPSGTGKTMAAEILGHELGLDLYKIDLASVVSKYIGETEKNLSRIFAEAETSNAILFFDEADALFGKRGEVREAHDRYANIEINYLLQRIEEYEGVIILASNLRKNMDEAFVRRIHATIEFPFPKVEDRLRIWQNVWPAKTPREDLDLEFMARKFELTGGNIRNIALASAFMGAENGGCVRMQHLIRATWQEYQKMGKVVMEGEFGKYADLAHFS
jgi:ATP-dependent 26S proteasome regulatory subunit